MDHLQARTFFPLVQTASIPRRSQRKQFNVKAETRAKAHLVRKHQIISLSIEASSSVSFLRRILVDQSRKTRNHRDLAGGIREESRRWHGETSFDRLFVADNALTSESYSVSSKLDGNERIDKLANYFPKNENWSVSSQPENSKVRAYPANNPMMTTMTMIKEAVLMKAIQLNLLLICLSIIFSNSGS